MLPPLRLADIGKVAMFFCLLICLFVLSIDSLLTNAFVRKMHVVVNDAICKRCYTTVPKPLFMSETKVFNAKFKSILVTSLTILCPFGANNIFTTITPEISLARNLPQDNGASKINIGKAVALRPILNLKKTVDFLTQNPDISLEECRYQLTLLPKDEKEFKRIFDEFSEDISYKQRFLDQNAFLVYYTKGFDGPSRPSLEADDAATTKMTAQYGFRNDAWVAIDDARSEVDYLLQTSKEGGKVDRRDLLKDLKDASAAITGYLSLAPPEVLREASQP